ncbi:MAG: tetratricopeptide repeat protein, partial [Planctomycetes bacterium]|nr:tetratricopeptide repeat protein [Planctomycetota bacterium]
MARASQRRINADERVTDEERKSAAVLLGDLAKTVPGLQLNLANKNSEVRVVAVRALGWLGLASKPAIPELSAILVDPDETLEIRIEAAWVLGKLGSNSESAVVALVKFNLNLTPSDADRDWSLYTAARDALKQIGLPSVFELLTNKEAATRRDAARVLRFTDPRDSRKYMGALLAALADNDQVVRSIIAGVLGQIGPEAKEAVPRLEALLNDQNEPVIRAAGDALRCMGPVALKPLLEGMLNENPITRAVSAQAIGKMRSVSDDAIQTMIHALKDPNQAVRESAIEALGEIGTPAIPALRRAIRNENPTISQRATDALGRSRASVTDLVDLANDKDVRVRKGAVEALGRSGNYFDVLAAVTFLRRALKDESSLVRSCAIRSLGRIGELSRPALPELEELLNHEDLPVRREVRQALRQIDPIGQRHSIRAQIGRLILDGKYREALAPALDELEFSKETLGDKHPEYATSLNNLAFLYQTLGDYAQAEPLFHQAVAIYKNVLGEKHRHYVTGLSNLGGFYFGQGDYARAEPLYRHAMAIDKEVVGEKHPHYAASLNNLAMLYFIQGDYLRAEPLYRQAREICQNALGENHPQYALSLNNLAMLYQSQGDDEKAVSLYEEALQIYNKVPSANQPGISTTLNNLAHLYQSQGDYAKAEPLYRQTLEIVNETVGDKHPKYALRLNNLAMLYQLQGDYAKAEDFYRQALKILKAVP